MKNVFLFMIMFSTALINVNAQVVQPADLPLAVQSNFKTRFPEASKIKWTKVKDLFEAEFVVKDVNTEAEYSEKGEWKKTSWEIPVEYTPMAIKNYIAANYPKFKIKELDIEEVYPSIDKLYVAEITKKKEQVTLYFKISGEFVKTEPEKKTDNPKK